MNRNATASPASPRIDRGGTHGSESPGVDLTDGQDESDTLEAPASSARLLREGAGESTSSADLVGWRRSREIPMEHRIEVRETTMHGQNQPLEQTPPPRTCAGRGDSGRRRAGGIWVLCPVVWNIARSRRSRRTRRSSNAHGDHGPGQEPRHGLATGGPGYRLLAAGLRQLGAEPAGGLQSAFSSRPFCSTIAPQGSRFSRLARRNRLA